MKTTVHNPDLARFVEAGTLYLGAPEAAELVRRHGVAGSIEAIAANIRADFLRWADFDKTARVAAHSAGGVIELMPVADDHRYSFKYVNGHPGNTRLGLSTVMAFGVLADVDTGAPLFLSELTLTTALRTAAMSALAAKTLARPDSHVMALIGNGAQSEFQALAFQHLVGITDLRLYDVDPAATAKLVANLQGSGLRATVCQSTAEAVKGADIVTTVTADKAMALILTPDMIEPGMHLNAVGGDCPGKTELHGDILDAAKVFVEYEPQSRVEGEIQHKPAEFAVTELWQVLRGERAGRDSADQVTVFDSVGFALEDFSALRFMQQTAERLGLGERIALIPQLADPKNLFGTLRASAPLLSAGSPLTA
ncbi:ornithine cyclodeaminase [Hydrogenophaga sp. RWCD_12]|uniref:ornithine cyclodeaminase n=1 Tax=Hydrogenophaga sp. RWCD_12 TaxID=3391190 RepID=UPI003985233C